MTGPPDDRVLRVTREDLDLDLQVGPEVERTLGERMRPGPPETAVVREGPAPAGDAIEVLIDLAALEEAWRHAGSTTAREVAGVLLGGVWSDRGRPFVHIGKALDARFTEERQSRVTFTHQTWQDLATRMDAMGTDEIVVGWYHSHPGYSVFMSCFDQFIHRHFFGRYGVALVMDPVTGEWGFFQNRGERVERLPGFSVTGRAGAERQVETSLRRMRGSRQPVPLAGPGRIVEVTVDEVRADRTFQESSAAFKALLRRFFGDLAPEGEAFSAQVAAAALTVVIHGRRLPPKEILTAIDEVLFDLSRDHPRCARVTVDVRHGRADGDRVCTAEWLGDKGPRPARPLDPARQVLTPRQRAVVTWHVPLDRLDLRA